MNLPQPVSWQARALLDGPDRRTSWVVAVAAGLLRPLPDLEVRLARLCAALPMTSARLDGDRWRPGAPPPVEEVAGEPLTAPSTLRPFDLAGEAPVRVVTGAGGRRLAVAAHHAAFDGLGLVGVLGGLLGGPVPPAAPERARGPADSPWPALLRLLLPADRVAASAAPPAADVVVVRELALHGPGVTARLAAACVAAAGARNAALGAPWRRVGVSLGVGGPAGAGYVSSYRRLDLRPDADVAAVAAAALRRPHEPFALVRAGGAQRLLAPLAHRFGDSLLVSNVGRHDLAGVTRLDFLPVARGPSAVAFGAAGTAAGPSTLALRARDLSSRDAGALLDDAVARLV